MTRSSPFFFMAALGLLACSSPEPSDSTPSDSTASQGSESSSTPENTASESQNQTSAQTTPESTPTATQTATAIATTPISEDYPYALPLYIRGSFNGWTGSSNELQPYFLSLTEDSNLYAEIELPFGNHAFKVADSAWSPGTNFGNPAGSNDQLSLGISKTLGDNGFDLFLSVETDGVYSFTVDPSAPLQPTVTIEFLYEVEATCSPDLSSERAYWLSDDTLVWKTREADSYSLYYAPGGDLSLNNGTVDNASTYTLTPAGIFDENHPLFEHYPHLKGQNVYDPSTIEVDQGDLITGQLVIGSNDADGQLCDATGIQLAGLLDQSYFYGGDDLGVTFDEQGNPSLKVWAPTAKNLALELFESGAQSEASSSEAMVKGDNGTWSITGDSSWSGKFYRYNVEVYAQSAGAIVENSVTDPYSISLAMNSTHSQIIDLNSDSLKPEGWDDLSKPELAAFEDIVLYELHVRDFSIADSTCTEADRGNFTAFSQEESDGLKHLAFLEQSGLTHIHLLPAFDIATIDENVEKQIEPSIPQDAGPASEEQQAAIEAVDDLDAFNWGYDPYHYMVPEGSYSTNPEGSQRILEFRKMVKSLNDMGLRIVMDQVYNHTNSAEQNDKSVLDKIVPGYYYRLDEAGNIQSSTCCPDTATENRMMEKLMLDALKLWAIHYKVDGFRFDLMGHHTTANMLNVREMFDALTQENDGVDGEKVYIYGEGWKFGSLDAVRSDDAFHQGNTFDSGIGSFNDRIRDSIRGGSPFSPLDEQGFVTGLYYDDNYSAQTSTQSDEDYLEAQRLSLLNLADNIRIAMAANLRDYAFIGADGSEITGAEVVYRGSTGAGYTADPQEIINYVSVHDNQTLFDNVQAKAAYALEGRSPESTSMERRLRMHNLALSITALGQGIPFFHAGTELLRSKSGDKDSYNSGDWFNQIDWTYENNNWGIGLPVAEKNQGDWDFWSPLLSDESLKPSSNNIETTRQHLSELLQLRKDIALLRLQTAEQINTMVSFLNAEAGTEQEPGLIIMKVTDGQAAESIDPLYQGAVVAINASYDNKTFTHSELSGSWSLHEVQKNSQDSVLSGASCTDGTLVVPAQSAIVCIVAEAF